MYNGPGTYTHYKGGIYDVIGLAIREESKDGEAGWIKEVIYRPLSPGSLLEGIDGVTYWSRRLDDFNEEVMNLDNLDTVPRFKRT